MIKVTFDFETAAEAVDFLESLEPTAPDATMSAGKPAGRPRGRPRKEVAVVDPTPAASAPAAPVAAPAAAAPAAPAASAPATPATVSVPFAALVEPLTKLADVDLDKAMSILASYGVKKASELKPEQFGTVLAEVNAALAVPTKQSLI